MVVGQMVRWFYGWMVGWLDGWMVDGFKVHLSPGTGGPSGRQPGAIFQLQGRERRTPFRGAQIYQGSFE